MGVFVCHCEPTIDGVVDTQTSWLILPRACPMWLTPSGLAYGCLDDGQDHIRQMIETHGLNRVVVAGCSQRTHESLFQRIVRQAGLNPYLMAMANIREHCAWVHEGQPESHPQGQGVGAHGRGSCQLAQPVHKLSRRADGRALVIGGGVAGMPAALTIADAAMTSHWWSGKPNWAATCTTSITWPKGTTPSACCATWSTGCAATNGSTSSHAARSSHIPGSMGDFRSLIVTQHRRCGC